MTARLGPNGYPLAQEAEIQSVLACMPYAQVYNAVEDGEVLILCDGGKYLISVDVEGRTSSAYTSTQPLAEVLREGSGLTTEHLDELEGWSTGWEC